MSDVLQAVEADFSIIDTDNLLDLACEIRRCTKRLEASKAAIDDELTRRMEAGDLDPNFSHNDWAFVWCEGRTRWAYPESVSTLEAQVKAAKKASEADGTAVKGTGAPFWVIREPK